MSARPDDGRVRTVFLGSGEFGIPSLRRLLGHPRIELVGVVTAPARPAGRHAAPRPTPIAALAAELGIEPVLAPERLGAPDAVAAVLDLRPGLAVVADYGQIVPPPLLGLPRGTLNLHPSALPRWRGASPVPATIAAGDPETAVSLMRTDRGLDTGPLLAQVRVPLTGHETAPELEARLAEAAADLLDSSLGPWLDGAIAASPQSPDGVVVARALRRIDGRLDPTLPAVALERLVRAHQPWPGMYVDIGGERLIVTRARVEAGVVDDVPGALVVHGAEPAIATVDGRLVLERVTPAGRRPMSGQDYLRGRSRGPGPL